MNVEEQLKNKTKELENIGKEINQLQRIITENREVINKKTSEALKLDGAISILKELQASKPEEKSVEDNEPKKENN